MIETPPPNILIDIHQLMLTRNVFTYRKYPNYLNLVVNSFILRVLHRILNYLKTWYIHIYNKTT